MKYIRTNDGVYELKIDEDLKKRGISNYFYIHHKDFGWNSSFEKSDLKNYKRADTIKELCDEFISGERLICKSRLKQTCEMLLKEKAEVYGAIWTDEGLIYVAKMNDKGELELL